MYRIAATIVLIVSILVLFSGSAIAENSSDCGLCHGNIVSDFNVGKINKDKDCFICHQQINGDHGGSIPVYKNDNPSDLYIGKFLISGTGKSYASVVSVPPGQLHWRHANIFNRGVVVWGDKITFDDTQCRRCHGPFYVNGFQQYFNNADCVACHKNNAQINHGNHGSLIDPTIWYLADGVMTRPKDNWSCINSSCHGSPETPVKTRVDGKQLCINCHNTARDGYEIDKGGHINKSNEVIHNSAFTVQSHDLNCIECHADDITKTHEGLKSNLQYDNTKPVSSNNFDFTSRECTTCHNNDLTPNGKAKLNDVIISTNKANDEGKTNCDSCHNITHLNKGDITASHTGLDTNCQNSSCHGSTLDADHGKRGVNCAQCHHSNNQTYAQAMAWKQKNCSDCHEEGHGIPLNVSVPDSILMYSAFTWSAPIKADVYSGEVWMPTEYKGKGAQMILSNRVKISGDVVWTWYRDNMQRLGWIVLGNSPSAGSNYFSVTFVKGSAKVVIWFYGGINHDPEPLSPDGSKIEILYTGLI